MMRLSNLVQMLEAMDCMFLANEIKKSILEYQLDTVMVNRNLIEQQVWCASVAREFLQRAIKERNG